MIVQEVGEAGACLPGEELGQKLEGACEQGTALLRDAARERLERGAAGRSTAQEGPLQCNVA